MQFVWVASTSYQEMKYVLEVFVEIIEIVGGKRSIGKHSETARSVERLCPVVVKLLEVVLGDPVFTKRLTYV